MCEGSNLHSRVTAVKCKIRIFYNSRVVNFILRNLYMEVLAFSVFTHISIMGDMDRKLSEEQDKCYPLLETGQESQNNLLQLSV